MGHKCMHVYNHQCQPWQSSCLGSRVISKSKVIFTPTLIFFKYFFCVGTGKKWQRPLFLEPGIEGTRINISLVLHLIFQQEKSTLAQVYHNFLQIDLQGYLKVKKPFSNNTKRTVYHLRLPLTCPRNAVGSFQKYVFPLSVSRMRGRPHNNNEPEIATEEDTPSVQQIPDFFYFSLNFLALTLTTRTKIVKVAKIIHPM